MLAFARHYSVTVHTCEPADPRFEGGQYSVPHPLLGQTVWVRTHGLGADVQVIIVHVADTGPNRCVMSAALTAVAAELTALRILLTVGGRPAMAAGVWQGLTR
jgi:hypothetical protein